MKKKRVKRVTFLVAAVVLAFGFTVSNITPAFADSVTDAEQLVEKSELTLTP